MSNFQSDELLPTDILDDPRKVVPLAAQVEDSGPPGEQAVFGELINGDFIEKTASWTSLPKTKRRLFSTFLNGQTEGTVLYQLPIKADMSSYINTDKEAVESMLYNDWCLQLTVELLGNPGVVGEIHSWFSPLASPPFLSSTGPPTVLTKIVEANQGMNVAQHLALHTFRNGRSKWTIPSNKPFSMFRQQDFMENAAGRYPQQDFTVGYFTVQCTTDIRSRTTQASQSQLIVWSSAIVKYRGSAFQPS